MAQIKNILFDFDGVILDSMAVRDKGFEIIFKSYPSDLVEELMHYHQKNGGLSRYAKIEYFFKEILGTPISKDEVTTLAAEFSEIMRQELVDSQLLINDSLQFIRNNFEEFNMHIVSGSDQEELRYLCRELGISKYFKSIHGSPTPKIELVESLLIETNYNKDITCLIGDSVNDFEAAMRNGIVFFGYNNKELCSMGNAYIAKFSSFKF